MAGTENSKASTSMDIAPSRGLIDDDLDDDQATSLVYKELQPNGTLDHNTSLSLPFETQSGTRNFIAYSKINFWYFSYL